jgi:3-oxoacyl-[acyl-carrier protein] reductase
MELGLKYKKALIMASSKGLGKSVAIELAQEGAEIMICGRNKDSLVKATLEIEQLSESPVHSVVADVSSLEGRNHLLSELSGKMGGADILICNSGGPPLGKFEDHDAKAWKDAFSLLLESTVGIIKGNLPYMKNQGWGRIITITSQAVKQPVAGLILSNSVRASVVGLVKTLSNELGPHNITVNNVMPGYTQTKRLESILAANPNLSKVTEEIPLGRIGKPEEFAAAVTFLASERASYITGISLPIDGGWIKGI